MIEGVFPLDDTLTSGFPSHCVLRKSLGAVLQVPEDLIHPSSLADINPLCYTCLVHPKRQVDFKLYKKIKYSNE